MFPRLILLASIAFVIYTLLRRRFPGTGDWSEGAQRPGTPDTGRMNRKEALALLGLAEGATKEEIVTAHRKLIQKLHPDRGGNEYLAAKINQARDFLLG